MGRLGALAKARLALEIIGTYTAVRLLLRRRPTAEVVEMLRAVRATARPDVAAVDLGQHLAWATVKVISRLPGDSRCLSRSLVVTRLLARRGVDSTIVFSVRGGERFESHAWVEVDGTPVLAPGGAAHQELMRL